MRRRLENGNGFCPDGGPKSPSGRPTGGGASGRRESTHRADVTRILAKAAEDVGNTIDPELGVELVPSDDEEKNEDKSEAPPAPIDCLDGGDRAGATFNLIMALAACYVACTIANWGPSPHQNEGVDKPLAGTASMLWEGENARGVITWVDVEVLTQQMTIWVPTMPS